MSGAHFHVHLDIILEAHLANPAFLDAQDAFDSRRGLPAGCRRPPRVGRGVHQFIAGRVKHAPAVPSHETVSRKWPRRRPLRRGAGSPTSTATAMPRAAPADVMASARWCQGVGLNSGILDGLALADDEAEKGFLDGDHGQKHGEGEGSGFIARLGDLFDRL